MNIIKSQKAVNKIFNLLKIEILNNYQIILNSILFFFLLNIFLFFFSGSVDLDYDLEMYLLICIGISLMSTITLMNSFIKWKDIDKFSKRLKTLPVKSGYVYNSLLIFLYLNLLIFSFLSVLLYLFLFKADDFNIFFYDFIKIQLVSVMFITFIFLIRMNRLMFLMAIIGGSIVIIFFSVETRILMKVFIQLFIIIKSSNFYFFLGFILISILLAITGSLIYKKRHYSEV